MTAPWNVSEAASAPADSERKRAITDDSTGTELAGEAVGNGRRFGIGVEPSAGAERVRCLGSERERGDRHDEGEQRDGSTEAIDERSPAAEHDGPLQMSLLANDRGSLSPAPSGGRRRATVGAQRPGGARRPPAPNDRRRAGGHRDRLEHHMFRPVGDDGPTAGSAAGRNPSGSNLRLSGRDRSRSVAIQGAPPTDGTRHVPVAGDPSGKRRLSAGTVLDGSRRTPLGKRPSTAVDAAPGSCCGASASRCGTPPAPSDRQS